MEEIWTKKKNNEKEKSEMLKDKKKRYLREELSMIKLWKPERREKQEINSRVCSLEREWKEGHFSSFFLVSDLFIEVEYSNVEIFQELVIKGHNRRDSLSRVTALARRLKFPFTIKQHQLASYSCKIIVTEW